MTNSAKTATAATAAAAAIAAGLYMVSPDDAAFVDDVQPVTVEAVTVTGVDVSGLSVDAVEVAAVSADLLTVADLSGQVDATAVSAPLNPSDDTMTVAEASVPETTAETADVETADVESVTAETVAPSSAQERFYASAVHLRDLRNMWCLTAGDEASEDFLAISRGASRAIDFVPYRKNLVRCIAEVHVPRSAAERETLRANLSRAKMLGYTAALLPFRADETGVWELKYTADEIRSAGLGCYFAYGGEENVSLSVALEKDKLSAALRALAPYADGFILGWRRTSAHLLLQDPAWSAFLAATVREANPECPIFGELYFGETAVNSDRMKPSCNMVANQSGICITGLGRPGLAVESIFASRLGGYSSGTKAAVIAGESGTSGISGLADLEARYLRAGCALTITLVGHGEENLDNLTTNSSALQ